MEAPPPVLVNNHRQDGWFAVAILVSVIETVFFALRIYCRRLKEVSWWLDDYLVALGYVSCLALNAVGIAITRATWDGQHTLDVLHADPGSIVLFLKLQIPLGLTYLCASVIPKLAIVALFIRIFIQRPFRIVCWIVEAFLALWLAIGIVTLFVFCTPFSANWKIPGTLTPHEHCGDLNALYKAASIPNVVTDIIMAALPVPVIWKLQKSVADKIGLLSTFCLAIVGLGFSIARLVAFFSVFSSQDVLWTSAYTGIFTTLEPASYFLISCMLTFRLLLQAPCCAGRKSDKKGHDVEEVVPWKASTDRQGSDAKTLIVTASNEEDAHMIDSVTRRHDVSYHKPTLTSDVTEVEPPKETRPKLEAAIRLNMGHNSARCLNSVTVVHNAVPPDHHTDDDSSSEHRDRSIMVTQEVTVLRTS